MRTTATRLLSGFPIRFLALGLLLVLIPVSSIAQEGSPSGEPPAKPDTGKAPWLEGVTLPAEPTGPAPVFSVEISSPDGGAVPATLSEDIPVLLSAQTELFGEKAPDAWKGQPLAKAEWTGQPSVHWFFDDVGKNKSTLASCEENLPANQMKVTPFDPSDKGAVSVFVSRPFKYEEKPGTFKTIFANGSKSVYTKVIDITPPTCGFEITSDGKTATIWTVEAPLNKYPLPKTAEVHFRGELFSAGNEAAEGQVANVELGPKMALDPKDCQLNLSKDKEITFKTSLQDNDRVDEKSVRFGICEVVNGEPVPVGEAGGSTIKPGSLKLPKQPYLFIEAKDPTGNHQVLCVPVSFK